MQCFYDAKGHRWTIELDIVCVRLIRAELKVDLLKEVGEAVERLRTDIEFLVDVLEIILRDQRRAARLEQAYSVRGDLPATEQPEVLESRSIREFALRLRGTALEDATVALLEELISFFQPARQKVLRAAWKKVNEIEGRAAERATEILESPETEARLRTMIQQMEADMSQALTPRATSGT